jgi:hypothetical protein
MAADDNCDVSTIHTRRVLGPALGVQVTDFQCRGGRHPLGAEEYMRRHRELADAAIVVIDRGLAKPPSAVELASS